MQIEVQKYHQIHQIIKTVELHNCPSRVFLIPARCMYYWSTFYYFVELHLSNTIELKHWFWIFTLISFNNKTLIFKIRISVFCKLNWVGMHWLFDNWKSALSATFLILVIGNKFANNFDWPWWHYFHKNILSN